MASNPHSDFTTHNAPCQPSATCQFSSHSGKESNWLPGAALGGPTQVKVSPKYEGGSACGQPLATCPFHGGPMLPLLRLTRAAVPWGFSG